MRDIAKELGKGWMKFWAFKYSLLGGTILGAYYPDKMEKQMGRGFKHVVLISKKGHTSCYLKIEERKEFGLYQIDRYVKPDGIKEFCALLKEKTDIILSTLRHFAENDMSREEFEKFANNIQEYLGYYTTPRQIIDHIDPDTVNLILEDLKKARLHAEPVFELVERVLERFCKQFEEQMSLPASLISSMTFDELKDYFKNGKSIGEDMLKARYNHSAVIITPHRYVIVDDEEIVDDLEKITVEENSEEGIVRGTIAYKGVVRGPARIIFDPAKVPVFNEGDVLITGMTRPDYLHLMKKSSAIVTDIGGLLCHAAIVAREIGKPCIIGTKLATKTFKDGDMVEVDAEHGIVKIIPRD